MEKNEIDRPLECSECKKESCVIYSEIANGEITHIKTCQDCPILLRRMGKEIEQVDLHKGKRWAGLACPNCGMKAELAYQGEDLGCSECYRVFAELLYERLYRLKKIYATQQLVSHAILHYGHVPHIGLVKADYSVRLTTLKEMLNKALLSEDYEKAAWLRDKIRAISEGGE